MVRAAPISTPTASGRLARGITPCPPPVACGATATFLPRGGRATARDRVWAGRVGATVLYMSGAMCLSTCLLHEHRKPKYTLSTHVVHGAY